MRNKALDLKTIVRGAYDLQKLRIQVGNRIAGNFKAKLGQLPGHSEEEMEKDTQLVLKILRESYKKITDGISTFPRQASFKGDEVISDYTELCLLAQYFDLEKDEKAHFNRMGNVLKEFPIYNEFLLGVRGVGAAMAGVIISEFDITKAEYPSSMWKYAGLDVSGGTGRSRKKEHLVESTYLDKEGKKQTKMGISFNPWLKTKLVGVLAGSFIKTGSNPYSEIYYNYKNRLENMPAHVDKTKGHRHAMAMRYMIKRFLVDLHREWRTIEGLPVAEEYSVAKLGMTHKAA